MIFGIGSDLVDIRRVERLLKKQGDRFKARVFTDYECRQGGDHAAFYAKRFAAKEACVKALGTGFGRDGVSMKDIGVENNENGAPVLVLTGGALAKLNTVAGTAHLSLSDELPYALAFVVIER